MKKSKALALQAQAQQVQADKLVEILERLDQIEEKLDKALGAETKKPAPKSKTAN